MKTLKMFLFTEKFLKNYRKIINLTSLRKLFKNPVKWIKEHVFNIIILAKMSIVYIFRKPRLKWIDNNIKGFLPYKEGMILYNRAKKLRNNSTIVEIGAYLGRSTCFIAESIKNKKINFYSIDTFRNQAMSEGLKNTFKEYYRNIYHYRHKIKIINGYSYEIVKKFQDTKIDMLWLDADHRYEACKKDIEEWFPLIVSNGLFVFHDYYPKKGSIGVKKAVDELIFEGKLKKIELFQKILVARKTFYI